MIHFFGKVKRMAGHRKDLEADLAPGDSPVSADYDRDFYSWSMEQARLLRDDRTGALDRDNLAEEIESLGREQFNKLVSALRVAMLHMLKWDHQPARRTRSWMLSIKQQRFEISNVLDDNPGLKSRVSEAIDRAYRGARIDAAKETGLDETEFPETCPYSFDDIAKRSFAR
jgi:hypothetical protein